ncbi:unnamed protein product, partial [Mesorhabditis belari]|uniref:Uncharacterized protein n=1 Tax=Mesorhabditis belari TaxID=2138241 RepID=A0AAF3FNH5_9BILA
MAFLMSNNRPPTYAATYHNIDVLWKPTLGGRKISRTTSTDSNDEELRRVSITELGPSSPTTTTPTMIPDYSDFATDKGMAVGAEGPRVRRMSLSEMIFGSPGNRRFTWSEKTMTEENVANKKSSVTEDARFKDIMRHQNRVNDDGGFSLFKTSDYRTKE